MPLRVGGIGEGVSPSVSVAGLSRYCGESFSRGGPVPVVATKIGLSRLSNGSVSGGRAIPSPVPITVGTGEGIRLPSTGERFKSRVSPASQTSRGAISSRVPAFSSFRAFGVGRLTHNKSPLCVERAEYLVVLRLRKVNGGRVERPSVCAASDVGRGQCGKPCIASRYPSSLTKRGLRLAPFSFPFARSHGCANSAALASVPASGAAHSEFPAPATAATVVGA